MNGALNFDAEAAQKELESAGEVYDRVRTVADSVEEKRSVTSATARAGELTLVYEVAERYDGGRVPDAVMSWAHENDLTLRSHTIDPEGTFVSTFVAVELTGLGD